MEQVRWVQVVVLVEPARSQQQFAEQSLRQVELVEIRHLPCQTA
jgi:hypothetical protein